MPSERDIVKEARMLAQCVMDIYGSDLAEKLLASVGTLADEVERLRIKLNDPCLVAGYHVCGGAHDLNSLTKD